MALRWRLGTHEFAARGKHVAHGAPRVDAAPTGRTQPQRGASRGAWPQRSHELGEVRPLGRGQFGDIAVPQDLGVVRGDPQ